MLDQIHIIFDGLTALGTVGAVVISLWATLSSKKKFKIHATDLTLNIYAGEDFNNIQRKIALTVELENQTNFPMHVLQTGFKFRPKNKKIAKTNHSTGFLKRIENYLIIQPLSYEKIEVIFEPEYEQPAIKQLSDKNFILYCKVLTNFGEKYAKIPDRQRDGFIKAVKSAQNTSGAMAGRVLLDNGGAGGN